jgi:hypothetical protein
VAHPSFKGDSRSLKTVTQQLAGKLNEVGALKVIASEVSTTVKHGITISESEITCEMEGMKRLIYLASVDNGKHKIELQGSAHNNFEQNLKEFKTLSRSLTFNEEVK